ncbi:glycosyltransferase [Vallitalea guaymasensis]|uniref:tetratricopeptide repeat-containing glycosyltransferase family 2 protein n=1 Tax=Vallitalea guaymasensis TaxID=1185412 RepID=UPI000DE4BAC1|nr:glycosyltransferase [Vallitalea guaymasensis]
MKISLCMIVKNEEKHITKCLSSVKDYVDEIVIIDTGSTDSSKEIASRYTDRIYDFKWCNDFAKARNFSLSKATNDWVLILDADECVTNFNKKAIEQIMYSNDKIVGRLKRVNLFEDGNIVKKYIERVNRLFNKEYFQYEGIIHEQIISKNLNSYRIKPINIEVLHNGYMDEVVKNTNKLDRNIELLKKAIKEHPQDPYLFYQMGKSYFMGKKYKVACKSFKDAIDRCKDFRFEYTEDLIESYGYSLLKCEKYQEALDLEKYKIYYGKSPDYYFVMGLIYMNNAKFEKAINTFNKCISDKEGKIEGINSYQPNYNIGVIYEVLGLKQEAIKFYQRCEGFLDSRQRICSIEQSEYEKICEKQTYVKKLIQEGELDEAEKIIINNINIYKDVELYSIYAVIKIIQKDYYEAERILKLAIAIDNQNVDILYNLAFLYQLTGRVNMALDFYKKVLPIVDNKELKANIRNQIINLEY